MRRSRPATVEEQRATITFNRFILKLRFTAKPPRSRGKSIYPYSHFPPCRIYDDAVSALVYRMIADERRECRVTYGSRSIRNEPTVPIKQLCATLAGVNFHVCSRANVIFVFVRDSAAIATKCIFPLPVASSSSKLYIGFTFCAPIPSLHPARKARRSRVIPSVGVAVIKSTRLRIQRRRVLRDCRTRFKTIACQCSGIPAGH